MTVEIINGIIIFIILALQLIGITFAISYDANFSKKRRIIMGALITLATMLVLQNYAEYVLIEYVFAPTWRTFVAAFGYSLRPAIIALYVYMVAPEKKHWWVWIPVVVNCILYNTAYFTDFVFTITEQNVWGGGPLSNFCLIISSALLAYQLFVTLQTFKYEKKVGALVPVVFTLLVVAGIIMDTYKNFWIPHWVDYVTIAVVACCVFFYLWMHFIFVRRYQDALLTEQRFNMMLSQMQPHFIYNSLSSIAEIEGVPEKAQKAIVEFSMYLRENLEATSLELVSFSKELEHVQKYVDLEKLRFGEKVTVEFNVQFADFFLPALTVQMLVENAIKHGITKKYQGGTVTISAEKIGKTAVITIRDNGVGFDANGEIKGNHFGLNNVRKRLEYTVGGALNIESEKGKGTCVTVTIPLDRKTEGGKEQ